MYLPGLYRFNMQIPKAPCPWKPSSGEALVAHTDPDMTHAC